VSDFLQGKIKPFLSKNRPIKKPPNKKNRPIKNFSYFLALALLLSQTAALALALAPVQVWIRKH